MTSSLITATVTGASFTGLAIGNTSTGAAQIYAADQNSGNVDIFNSQWQQVGALTDPNLPAGFTAFNVQNIGGTLYVTYANPNQCPRRSRGRIQHERHNDNPLDHRSVRHESSVAVGHCPCPGAGSRII